MDSRTQYQVSNFSSESNQKSPPKRKITNHQISLIQSLYNLPITQKTQLVLLLMFLSFTGLIGISYGSIKQIAQNSNETVIVDGQESGKTAQANSEFKEGENLQIQLYLLVAMAAITLGLSALILKAISQPIQQLQQVTSDLAKGDYSAPITPENKDEIGQSIDNLNQINFILSSRQQSLFFYTESLRISHEIKNNFDPFKIQKILKLTADALNLKQVLLYQFKSDETLQLITSHNPKAILKSNELIPARDELAVLADTRIIEFDKTMTFPLTPLLLSERISQGIVLPIKGEATLLGFLIIESQDKELSANAAGISILQIIANQLQLILERDYLKNFRKLEENFQEKISRITGVLAAYDNLSQLLTRVVTECREALTADRVIVYQFDEKWYGTIVSESVKQPFSESLKVYLGDPCFAEKYVRFYQQGRVRAINNIETAGLGKCYLEQLRPFQIKANLVVPILKGGELFGLLIAHHCQAPHAWNVAEMDFLKNMGLNLGLALKQLDQREQIHLEKAQLQAKVDFLTNEVQTLQTQLEPAIKGNINIRCSNSEGEIGTLADKINQIFAKLNHLISSIQSVPTEALQLLNNHQHLTQLLAADNNNIDEQMQLFSTEIEQLKTTVEMMGFAVNNSKENVALYETGVDNSHSTIELLVAQMGNIAETVAATTRKVEHLGESSQEISKVVGLISRFAAQTHLLALKASIEAARAGEEGRGFAVIADEVRSLAASSAEATAEIETLVASIQQETKEVAAAMEAGSSQVGSGSQYLTLIQEHLGQLKGSSSQIYDVTNNISDYCSTSARSSETVQQVLATVNELFELSKNKNNEISDIIEQLQVMTVALNETVQQLTVSG